MTIFNRPCSKCSEIDAIKNRLRSLEDRCIDQHLLIDRLALRELSTQSILAIVQRINDLQLKP